MIKFHDKAKCLAMYDEIPFGYSLNPACIDCNHRVNLLKIDGVKLIYSEPFINGICEYREDKHATDSD
jgi:hypothetical protein